MVGAIIRGGGGIRKVRWGSEHGGKSGGVRILYYWHVEREQIFMLFLFPKNEQENLTDAQLKLLRSAVEEQWK